MAVERQRSKHFKVKGILYGINCDRDHKGPSIACDGILLVHRSPKHNIRVCMENYGPGNIKSLYEN